MDEAKATGSCRVDVWRCDGVSETGTGRIRTGGDAAGVESNAPRAAPSGGAHPNGARSTAWLQSIAGFVTAQAIRKDLRGAPRRAVLLAPAFHELKIIAELTVKRFR
jgi:hypothetical protein